MHLRLILFVWRRKFLFLGSSILFLIAIWCWGLFYQPFSTSNNSNDITHIVSIGDFEGHENLLHKLGISQLHLKSNYDSTSDDKVKFVKPTGETANNGRLKSVFNQLDSLFFDKNTENLLRNLEMPSRDAIARRRMADELKMQAQMENKYEHDLQRMGVPIIGGLNSRGAVKPLAQRLVHFDLKGAPPKISYLKRLLPVIKSLGATGILMEYEDMFPYTGFLSEISAKNAYDLKELRDFIQSATTMGLSIMPLVQTFGHLEFALKLKAFKKLREVDDIPQSICPSLNTSMQFITEMITQIVQFHQNSPATMTASDFSDKHFTPIFTHIHIGCDEVSRMAECPRCKTRARDELFLSHVSAVAHIIRNKWPELKIVIWDDMMRHISLSDLQDSNIGKLVEPMVWVYAEDIYRFITTQTWDKYSSIFETAWAAPAFKGAHGETLLIPPTRRHLENTMRWMSVAHAEGSRFTKGFQGIALTGWQRYDHFAVLCELLPVALPSLALCLSTTTSGFFETDAKKNPVLSSLTCPEQSIESLARKPWIDLQKDTNLQTAFSRCMFPGSAVFRYVLRLTSAIQEVKDYLELIKYNRGWLTLYNIKHNYTLPTRVDELIQDSSRLVGGLVNMASIAEESMSDVYDKWTIVEFIEQRIYPFVDELKKLEDSAEALKHRRVWQQRPLPYLNDLKKFDLIPKETNKS